jgi:hypothetical protein
VKFLCTKFYCSTVGAKQHANARLQDVHVFNTEPTIIHIYDKENNTTLLNNLGIYFCGKNYNLITLHFLSLFRFYISCSFTSVVLNLYLFHDSIFYIQNSNMVKNVLGTMNPVLGSIINLKTLLSDELVTAFMKNC